MAVGWKINRGRATYQNLDGEVVIIDLHSGMYFSLRGSAAVVWDALEHEPTADAILALFADGGEPASARIHSLLESLRGHELIERIEHASAKPLPMPVVAWTEPLSEAYSDMQELLLADPIHDIDETGWPRAGATKA